MGHVRVKICGVRTVEEACTAAALGADAVGLNFYDRSPRYLTPEGAGEVLRALPPFVEPVGLFVNRPVADIVRTLQAMGRIRSFQWHGERWEAGNPHPFGMIPAFAVRDRETLSTITLCLDACRAEGWMPAAVLLDAHVPGRHGGTGQTAPWDLLADFRPGVPVILAGGLTPENVGEAIRIVRPYAVDVASGVEESPGRKDPDKVRRFIANARAAAGNLPP